MNSICKSLFECLRTVALGALASLSMLKAQDTPPFLSLQNTLGGAMGAPAYSPTGTPFRGRTVNHVVNNVPAMMPGAFYFGATRADIHRFGGILVPSPDTMLLVTTDANGGVRVPMQWPSSVADADYYGQFLFFDASAPQGVSFSNAARIHTFSGQAEVDYWSSMSRNVAASYGGLAEERALTATEAAKLTLDPRVSRLMRAVNRRHVATADPAHAIMATYRRGNGQVKMVVVPIQRSGVVRGAAFLYDLDNPVGLGTALMAGDGSVLNSAWFYGTNGDEVTMNFRSDHKFLGATETFVSPVAADVTWEDFKRWLSSESGAEDLPWWLDLLCGIACGDALVGTHNPLSISACLHCVGAYIAACVPASVITG